MRRIAAVTACFALQPLAAPQALPAQEQVANPHVTISLVPEFRQAAPGRITGVGVRFQLEPGWHIYWENPGQSGIATEIAWSVTPAGRIGALRWPVPELFPIAGVVTHVHHGDVVLTTDLTLPPSPAASPLRIIADIRYGICRDLCIPGKARLVVELPWARGAPAPAAQWRTVRALAAERQILPSGGPMVRGRLQDSLVALEVRSDRPLPGRIEFFPSQRGIAPAAVSIAVPPGATRATLLLPLIGTPAGTLRGVLVTADAPRAARTGYQVEIALTPK